MEVKNIDEWLVGDTSEQFEFIGGKHLVRRLCDGANFLVGNTVLIKGSPNFSSNFLGYIITFCDNKRHVDIVSFGTYYQVEINYLYR